MAGLSLKVLLELQKKGFDRSINAVKNSINSLKRMAAGLAGAFVGGFGLTALAKSFQQTATRISQVEATLKNVSSSSAEYADNMHFLKRIAEEYGQEQNALIMSFARFSAAAKASNLTLQQQRDIFEAMTRAAGAYHLSADQTSMAMLALEQMVSKGVVASEELRRQLGQYIPGAVNIMAKAFARSKGQINGTVEDLMKAMKQGQVLSAEVLPYFAKELNAATQGANFDSLVSNINRFKNAWTDFVNSSEFTGFYNNLVKIGTQGIKALGDNFKRLGRIMLSVFASATTMGIGKLVKYLYNAGRASKPLVSYIQILRKDYDNLGKSIERVNKELVATKNNFLKYGNKRTDSTVDAKAYYNYRWGGKIDRSTPVNEMASTIAKNRADAGGTFKIRETYAQRVKRLEQEVLWLQNEQVKKQQELNKYGAASVKNITLLGYVWRGVVASVKSIAATMKGMLISMAASAIIGILTNVILKLRDARREAERIKNIVNDSSNNWHNVSDDTQTDMNKLDTQLYILENSAKGTYAYNKALETLNTLLGLTGEKALTSANSLDELRKAVEDGKTEIKEENEEIQRLAELDRVTGRIAELTNKMKDLENDPDWGKLEFKSDRATGDYFEVLTRKAEKLRTEYNKLTKECNQLKIAQANLVAGAPGGTTNQPTIFKPRTKEELAIMGALDAYKSEQDELQRRLDNTTITQDEFNKGLAESAKKAKDAIGAYKNLEDQVKNLDDGYYDTYREIMKNSKGGGRGDNPLLDAFKTYIAEKHKLDNLFKNGFIDKDTYKKSQLNLIEDLEKVVGAQDNVEESVRELGGGYLKLWNIIQQGKPALENYLKYTEKLAVRWQKLKKGAKDTAGERDAKNAEGMQAFAEAMAQRPNPKGRNTLFDYKKTDADIAREIADAMQDNEDAWKDFLDLLKDVKEKYGDLGGVVSAAIAQAEGALESAASAAKRATDAADISEITEDLKEMKKELETGEWESFTSIIGGLEGIAGAIESCKDAFEKLDEKDADFFDGLKAGFSVLNTLITTLETINNVFKTLEATEEIYNKIKAANRKKDIAMSAANIKMTQMEAAATTAGVAQEVAAKQTSTEITKQNTREKAKNTAAGAGESVASIPYVGPILAVAAIASVAAALAASFAKFANGGIIGGSSTTGDKNIIRANAGEMVIPKGDQARLWNFIKGGSTGGGRVEFVLRGSDLIGAINNEVARRKG